MSTDQPQPEPRTKRLRLRAQFSLQTLLLLMLVAALLFAWMLTPRLREEPVGGGALMIRAVWSDPPPTVSTMPEPQPSPVPTGRWILYDRCGEKRIGGRFAAGEPSGRWRYFDEEGREVLAGAARHGQVHDTWTARHPNGQVSHQVTYAQQATSWWQTHDFYRHLSEIGKHGWISLRTGPARQNWPNGQPRIQGQFANDRREGPWTFFGEDGQQIAQGNYRHGNKHGTWQYVNKAGDASERRWYLAGRKIDDPAALRTRLSDHLLGDDPLQQVRAARNLERLGDEALPILCKALRAGDHEQQLLAIRALKHLGPQAADAVDDLDTLGGGELSQVRLTAQVALAEIEPERAGRVFARWLAYAADERRADRDLVVECLAQAGPTGLRQLVAELDSPEPAVRLAAFDVLARMHLIYFEGPPVRRDPHVDIDTLDVVFHRTADHSDPKIRERFELYEEMQRVDLLQPQLGPWKTGGMF